MVVIHYLLDSFKVHKLNAIFSHPLTEGICVPNTKMSLLYTPIEHFAKAHNIDSLYNHKYEQAQTKNINKLTINTSKILMLMMHSKGFRVFKSQEVKKNGEVLVNYVTELRG